MNAKSLTLALTALAASLLAPATSAHASEAIIKKARCIACHAVDKPRIGPPYVQVAAKYKGDAAAAERLFHKVREGGSGVWGEMPMPPQATGTISDDDLKKAIQWILELN